MKKDKLNIWLSMRERLTDRRKRRRFWARWCGYIASLKLTMIGFMFAGSIMAATSESQRQEIVQSVVAIQRADYEGDRTALKRLYDKLGPYVDDKELGAKVQYWRGFALWRRAMNGSNEKIPAGELEQDYKQAVTEFEGAMVKAPAFADARLAAGSTMGYLLVVYSMNPDLAPEFKDPAHKQEFADKALAYMNAAQAAEPGNPRVWWVLGPVRRYLSNKRGEGAEKARDAAIEMYQKGLEAARTRKTAGVDPLIPSWGEPECLMGLAVTKSSEPTPDLPAAGEYARSALKLVPYWHFVKDILIPSIEEAKAKRG